mgnify:CR=1 FL=1
MAENGVGGFFGVGQHGACAFNKARAEGLVREIGAGFVKGAKRIALAHGAHAEPGDLGEDEPHPMGTLLAGAEFGEGGVVDGGLGGEEVVHRTRHLNSTRTAKIQYSPH